MLDCGGNPLKERLRAQTTSKKTPKMASPTQAETASGVCPTSAFYDCVQKTVHHDQFFVQTRRLAHGPFQLAVH